MQRNTFINDDISTAFAAVDLVKNAVLGLWNLASTAFYAFGTLSETYAGISQAVLNDPKKSAEHFSDAKADVIEVKNSIVEVCNNLSSIVLDSVGIGYDIVNGLIWAGHGLVSGIKLATFSVAETYNNWNQDVFYDASDTLPEEVEEFFDAPLASYTEDVTSMGSDFSYNNDNSI